MVLEFVETILRSNVFLSAFFAWLSAQVLKTIIAIVVQIKTLQRYLTVKEQEEYSIIRDVMSNLFWKTGGMPSSHTSMSSALAVAIGFEKGFTSTIFFVTFFFACIVIRDSAGVRLLTGKLARRVNVLIKTYNSHDNNKLLEELKVVEGHTFSEVFVGIVLGVFISIIIYLF